MTVAERIARLIDAKGWTQDEAAHALGVSRFTVNSLINGRRTLTPEMAVRMETVFETTADGLLKQQVGELVAVARDDLALWIRQVTGMSRKQWRR